MKRWYLLLCIWISLLFGGLLISPAKAEASDLDTFVPELDYSEAEKSLSRQLDGEDFDLGNYIEGILDGSESFSLASAGAYLKEGIKKEFARNKNQLFRVIAVVIGASVFTNFSNVFKNSQVADTGFYVAYLLMFSTLALSFYEASQTAVKVLSGTAEFMKALAPAFFMSVTAASGAGTSLVFYQIALMVIWLVDTLLVRIVLPMVHIYFVLHLANHLLEKDLLSKTTDLIEEGVGWCLKTMLGLVAGYNFIQGIIAPAADEVKKSSLMRMASAVPGVGNAIGSVTETVLGAGVLIKNAVGAGGIMALLLLMAGPVIKLFVYMLFFRLGAALVQPVSDKRMLECLMGAATAAKLLLFTVCVGGALFLLTIAVVMSATNIRI